jgi:hypothetical protein
MTVPVGVNLFVIMTGMTSLFGRTPKNGGSTPKDGNYVNIINFITMASLFLIKIRLTNDTIDSLGRAVA